MADLLQYLESAARSAGAVHFLGENSTVAFARLWASAHGAAGWLARNYPTDEVIAGVLEPSESCLTTLFGCLIAGRTFASLPRPARGLDGSGYESQLRELTRLSNADVLVLPRDVWTDRRGLAAITYDDIGQASPAGGSGGGGLIQFTSGSTGPPKGVRLELGQLGTNVRSMALALRYREGDAFFSWLPLSHDMGLVGMCFGALAALSDDLGRARALCLAGPDQFAGWLQRCSELRTTVTMVPNFALDFAARRLERATRRLDLSELRCLVTGSETVQPDTLRRFTAAATPYGFRERSFCPGYGLAEATLAVTITRSEEPWRTMSAPPDAQSLTGAADVVGLGKPLDGVEVRIGRAGEHVGEIQVRGEAVAKQYLGGRSPIVDDGWLATRDIGYLDAGELFFVARASDRLVVAGKNLDASYIEHHLGAISGVRTGCCAVIQDDAGGGYSAVVESTVAGSAASLESMCRAIANAGVAVTGILPRRVVVVKHGQLPKTPSGKPQRFKLRRLLADGEVETLTQLTLQSPG
jgi:acyl-CoA synthetase (AMP-forming)/AMP-acid ligase II